MTNDRQIGIAIVIGIDRFAPQRRTGGVGGRLIRLIRPSFER